MTVWPPPRPEDHESQLPLSIKSGPRIEVDGIEVVGSDGNVAGSFSEYKLTAALARRRIWGD